MPEQPKLIKLKVLEALQDDAYKGIARIDTEVMRALGLNRGDIISIQGERETVAIVDRSYPADIGEGIIRIDGLTRKNSKTGIGEKVAIRKAQIKTAKKVTIAPAQQGIVVQGDPEAFKSGLLGRAVMKGDLVSLGGAQRRKDLMQDLNEAFEDLQDLFRAGLGGMGFQNIRFKIISTNPAQAVLITEDTELQIHPKATSVEEESIPEVTYEDIGGLTEEIRKIREMVELPLKHPEVFDRLGIEPPKGVLLHGPPGTGKTLLAKAVANESEANFILLNGPEIMSKFYGESEKKIRDLFEEAEKNAPSIIFIDEIDAIAPKREETQGEVERRVVSQLLTMMDGLNARGKVVVIGATNRVNSIDPALRRPGRFDRELEISVPDKKGRLTILKIHTRAMPMKKDVNLEELAAKTHGFVGADLESLAKEAAMSVLRKALPDLNLDEDKEIPQEALEKMIIGKEDFDSALKIVRPSAMREVLVEVPNISWEDVGGLDNIKQELIEAVEWPIKHRDSFERMGINPPRGILLYGPPGTGKTLLAKAVAKESESNFINIKGPSLLSMWVGKSLPYDEELIVKDGGMVKRIKIGEIVENKLDLQVLAFDKDKRIRFTKIGDHIKHKLDSKLMEVTTRTGRKIKVTEDHSLFSFVNGKITDIPTNYLIPNESYIVIPKNLNLPREDIKEINLYEYFKKDEEIAVCKVNDYIERAKKIIGLGRTASILNISKKYLADVIYKDLAVEITKFDNLLKEAKLSIDFNEIVLKFRGSKHNYPSILKVNKDFWRMVGIWIAEGDFNSDTIRIHNQNPEIREDIRKICKQYEFQLSEMKTCTTINSLFLQKVFKNVLNLQTGAVNKKLPSLSFILDKESKANLLKGYFSGDGSIHEVEREKYQIEASTISKSLANDLLYLLLDFGIVATCRIKEAKLNSSKAYRISILGVNNFEKFRDIGFIDQKRNSRINEYIISRKWARADLIPLSGELYELASQQSSVYSTNKSIGKEALKNMLILVDRDKSKYKEYWNLVEGDLYLDLVKEIKIVDSEEYVYDISVPGEQNFIGGFGGVVAHNSEEGVRKVFERARQVSPCIIFFDEIDALAGKRGMEMGSKVTERVLNQMLSEMDGLEDLKNVVVIGATNRPDMLDSALMRPGRFDRILLVDIPNEKGREKILQIHTKKMPLVLEKEEIKEIEKYLGKDQKFTQSRVISDMASDKIINQKDIHLLNEEKVSIEELLDKDKLIQYLVKKTEGFVGADIESFVREAAIVALRKDINSKKITLVDFDEALLKVKPSVSEDTAKRYKKIEENYLKKAKIGGLELGPLYAS